MKLLISSLALITLTGCQPSTVVDHFSDYQRRLARVLNTSPPEPINLERPSLFSKRDTKLSIPKMTLSFREFYGLDGCSLKPVIAKRNTSLGKTFSPSQQLMYEYELLDALSFCVQATADQNLRTIFKEKQDQLPLHWMNLFTQTDEFRAFISAPRGTLNTDNIAGYQQTIIALRALLELDGGQTMQPSQLETHLKALNTYPLISQMDYTQIFLSQSLLITSQWLQKERNSLGCETGLVRRQKLEFLQNIFNRYFVEHVQPVGSQLNHYFYSLQPLLNTLAKHPLAPQSLQQFIFEFSQRFDTYQQAMKAHIEVWQTIYRDCALTPGQITG